MAFETIRYETTGPVAILTLNRPDKLNAINPQMMTDICQAMDQAEADSDIRVIVLRGEGKAFSAGIDLEVEGDDPDDRLGAVRRELELDFRGIMRFWDSPKTTIAAVHKYCLGSAMEMAVACDITVSAEGCRFGAPEVKFGSGIVALILPWLIGPKVAKELLLTGDDKVTAERALALGLVNRIVPEADCFEEAMKIAREIAVNDRVAVDLTKIAINRTYDIMGMRQALLQGLELDIMAEASETPESKEFYRIVAEEGAKAAVAWRDARIKAI
jgi:enoyl-CoA hydratase